MSGHARVLTLAVCILLLGLTQAAQEYSSARLADNLFLQVSSRVTKGPFSIDIPKDPVPACDIPLELPAKDPPATYHISQMYPECVFGKAEQGVCSTCWAFTASRVLATRLCMQRAGRSRFWLSMQQLARCVKTDRDGVCYKGESDPTEINDVLGFVPAVHWPYSASALLRQNNKNNLGNPEVCSHPKLQDVSVSEDVVENEHKAGKFEVKDAPVLIADRIEPKDDGYLITFYKKAEEYFKNCHHKFRVIAYKGQPFKATYPGGSALFVKELPKEIASVVQKGSMFKLRACAHKEFVTCFPRKNDQKHRNYVITACPGAMLKPEDHSDLVKKVQHAIMTRGPVAISFDASNHFGWKKKWYHAVAAEGWKTDSKGAVHWIVGNSWGPVLAAPWGQASLQKKISAKKDKELGVIGGKAWAYLLVPAASTVDYNVGIVPKFSYTYHIKKLTFTESKKKNLWDLKVKVVVPSISTGTSLFLTRRRERYNFIDSDTLGTFMKENKKGNGNVAKVNVNPPKYTHKPDPECDPVSQLPTQEVEVDIPDLTLGKGEYELRLQLADKVWIDRVDFDVSAKDEITLVEPQHPAGSLYGQKAKDVSSDSGKDVSSDKGKEKDVSSKPMIKDLTQEDLKELSKLKQDEDMKGVIDQDLQNLNLKVETVNGDGFCLYRAICEASRSHKHAQVRTKLKDKGLFANDDDNCKTGDAYKAACGVLKQIISGQLVTDGDKDFHRDMCTVSAAWTMENAPVVENMPMLLNDKLGEEGVRVGLIVPLGNGVQVLGLADASKCGEDAVCLVYGYRGARHWDAVVPAA